MKFVFVAIPSYKAAFDVETVHFLLKMKTAFDKAGIHYLIEDASCNGLIHNVRNRLIARAMAIPNVTDVLFLDDDVGPKPEDAVRLVNAPVEVVAGVYPAKKEEPTWFVQYLENCDVASCWNADLNLLKVAGVPAGFLRVSRSALQKMIHAYPELEYEDKDVRGHKAWGLFYPQIIDRHDWGEDMIFCKRWTDIGGEVWVDPTMHLKHVGRKVYSGCFGEWLMEEGRKRQAEAA